MKGKLSVEETDNDGVIGTRFFAIVPLTNVTLNTALDNFVHPGRTEYMSLLQQLFDGSMFDVFIAGGNMS